MIRRLTPRDKINFLDYCSKKDKYSNFYITRDNKRLFLSDFSVASKVFNDVIKHGDVCYVCEERDFCGVLLITGHADKFFLNTETQKTIKSRKYLKILSDSRKVSDDLFRCFVWNYKGDVYLKLKADHPVIRIAKKYGFYIVGKRRPNNEILMFRKHKQTEDSNGTNKHNYKCNESSKKTN